MGIEPGKRPWSIVEVNGMTVGTDPFFRTLRITGPSNRRVWICMTQGSRFSKIACFEGSGYLGNKIFVSKKVTTTPPKTNSSHLNSWMVGIVVSFWGWPIFRCYVCFREGSWWLFFNPNWNIWSRQIGFIFPNFSGWKFKTIFELPPPRKNQWCVFGWFRLEPERCFGGTKIYKGNPHWKSSPVDIEPRSKKKTYYFPWNPGWLNKFAPKNRQSQVRKLIFQSSFFRGLC